MRQDQASNMWVSDTRNKANPLNLHTTLLSFVPTRKRANKLARPPIQSESRSSKSKSRRSSRVSARDGRMYCMYVCTSEYLPATSSSFVYPNRHQAESSRVQQQYCTQNKKYAPNSSFHHEERRTLTLTQLLQPKV